MRNRDTATRHTGPPSAGRRAWPAVFLGLALALALGWAGAEIAAPVASSTIDGRLTSMSIGRAGGTLAVRVHTPAAAGAQYEQGGGQWAQEIVTFVPSPGIGQIAVLVREPEHPRYPEGAPVVVSSSGFFVPFVGFHEGLDTTRIGAIYVSYLWPGRDDPRTGASSGGIYDYGGELCLAALRDVLRFATGASTNVEGQYLHEITSVTPNYAVSGLYAFSHSGITGTNVLALHGASVPGVRFFVGRENPTVDELYALEPGHYTDDRRAVRNPLYNPDGYTPTSVDIDYSTVYWRVDAEHPEGWPAFAVEDGPDYVCSPKHPQMWDKDYWSQALLAALRDNGALDPGDWPPGLATPEEAAADWPARTTVDAYPLLAQALPDLKVMLVFAADDHVQSAIDKPHIHHAFDGFRHRAGLWCRMNPDRAYSEALLGAGSGNALPDNPANVEPDDWRTIREWGYRAPQASPLHVLVPLAAVAEMCDRTYTDTWDGDLDGPLY